MNGPPPKSDPDGQARGGAGRREYNTGGLKAEEQSTELPRPFDLRITENIEAIAISIAMALVLKFFVIEAYQIPTGSMQPTILGDRVTGIKDRMLADKLITMLRPPQRWEVMIFRFPLDERRLYVKRILGLPGETLEILGGDVWIDGKIARKPDHVNDSVLKHIAEDDGPMDVGRWFTSEGGIEVAGEAAVFPDQPGDARLRLRRQVLDDYLHGYDPHWGIAAQSGGDHAVGDLELSLDARLGPGAEALKLVFESDEADTRLVLPREGSTETARVEIERLDGGAGKVVPIEGDLALPAGQEVHVRARYVDRELLVEVDGEAWLRYRDDVSGPRTDRPRRGRVAVALPGGGEVSGLRVRRDIYYLPATRHELGRTESRWEIPDDSYFGMGDNTQASHDSRTWQTQTYTLSDGREITGFWFPHSGYGPMPPDANPQATPDGLIRFADVHGDTATFTQGEVVEGRLEYAPFIHERYLLGKAGVVFWPVVDPFRWKLIR